MLRVGEQILRGHIISALYDDMIMLYLVHILGSSTASIGSERHRLAKQARREDRKKYPRE